MYMGFCGIDDSVPAGMLLMLSTHYRFIEWGVLLRKEMEGQPRYATQAYLNEVVDMNKAAGGIMNLAGHLCGNRCQQVLDGDWSYVADLLSMGFKRVQVNATTANGVSLSPDVIPGYIENLRKCMRAVAEMEFIVQCNDETKPIWEALVAAPEPNMSTLQDASCGMGTKIEHFPAPTNGIPSGYAGGISPANIAEILQKAVDVSRSNTDYRPAWIDMESGLRSKVSKNTTELHDVFSIEKCFLCAETAVKNFGFSKL